jgi:hypothetical protein
MERKRIKEICLLRTPHVRDIAGEYPCILPLFFLGAWNQAYHRAHEKPKNHTRVEMHAQNNIFLMMSATDPNPRRAGTRRVDGTCTCIYNMPVVLTVARP